MTIQSTTPTSLRRPGAYSEFQFLQSGQTLVPLPLRVVVIAEQLSSSTTPIELPIQVFSEADADAKFGVGSFCALMCRDAFAVAKLKGASPEIWACPIAEPAGGVKAAETITVTAASAQAGNVVLTVNGKTITVGVNANDSQNTIASAIQQQIAAQANFLPLVATVATNVVTCTNTTKGVNGNDVPYALVSAPVGVAIAFAQSVAGTGAAVIQNALNALYDKRYHAVAISNHTTTDIATLLTQRAQDWSYTFANYRFYFMGSTGTLASAQTLQAAANDFGIVIVACDSIPACPGELAVAAATAEFARSAPNANLDGDILPFPPPSGAKAWTDSQIESALNGGVTPLTPSGSFVKIERLVTTEISVSSAPFEPLRDLAYPRTASYIAEQIAIAFVTGFPQQTLTNDILTRVRDMIVGIHRAAEDAGYLRDVDTFLTQITTEIAPAPAGRIVANSPFRPAGPLHQGVFVNVMYL